MKLFSIFWFIVIPLWAQQLVIPSDLDDKQGMTYKKITEAVAAPCCSNAIPVAYHESGMSLYIRDIVRKALLNGASEKEVMAQLEELRLGNQKLPVIFAVPENNILGWATWFTPSILVALGGLLIYLIRNPTGIQKQKALSNEELIETYREYIHNQVEAQD